MKTPTSTLSSIQKLRVLWKVFRHPHTSPVAKFLLGGALIYGILPFDFIPDFLPVIGLTDDAVVWIVAIAVFMRMTKEIRKEMEKTV